MLHINDLTDDCLRQIFSRLSLSCKLTLHRICPRWRSLQYSVTCNHKSLTLLIGSGTDSRALLANSCLKVPYLDQIEPHNLPFSEHSTLEMPKLSENVTAQLKHLLPNLASLQLCFNECEVSQIDCVLQLLGFWSFSLKYLSLYYNSQSYRIIEGFNGVLSHIQLLNEHCLALDCLSIELQGSFRTLLNKSDNKNATMFQSRKKIIPTKQLELPCLGWLKKFRFYSKDRIDVLFHSFNSYAGESLKSVAVGNALSFVLYFHLGDIFQPVPKMVPKFTLLNEIRAPTEFSQYTALTTLSLEMYSRSWTQFIAYLSPLKSLVHVKLTVTKDVLSRYDSTPSYELAQLPSIRIIQIELQAKTYRELQSRHWSHIFPSLELLELKLFNQGQDMIGWMQPTREQVRAARLNLLLEPFKWQCAKLRRIVTLDKYEDEVDAERKVWGKDDGINWEEMVQE